MVYVNMCDVRMSVLTLRDQRRTLGSLLHHYLPYPFEARTLLEPGADELCLGSTVNHIFSLSSFFDCWGYRKVWDHALLLTWVLGSELRSLRLGSKCSYALSHQ